MNNKTSAPSRRAQRGAIAFMAGAAALCLLLAPTQSAAQSWEDWDVRLGVGGAFSPVFEGADSYEIQPFSGIKPTELDGGD